jgi:DNA-binding transcriptional regulator PaaX
MEVKELIELCNRVALKEDEVAKYIARLVEVGVVNPDEIDRNHWYEVGYAIMAYIYGIEQCCMLNGALNENLRNTIERNYKRIKRHPLC